MSEIKEEKARGEFLLIAAKCKAAPGIYAARWEAQSGELSELRLAAAAEEPSFLVCLARGADECVYLARQSAAEGGLIEAYRYDAGKGTLRLIGSQPTLGIEPVQMALHPDGRSLYAANYWQAGVTSFRIGEDGCLFAPVSHFEYRGRGPRSQRQDEAHAHGVTISPDGRFLLVQDLGLDRMHVYRIDAATAELEENAPAFQTLPAGSGPRHAVFHPSGKWLYSLQELDSTLVALAWESAAGAFTQFDSASILPEEFAAERTRACEIALSADGRFLYANNRGADFFFVFGIDQEKGTLRLVQKISTGGLNARHFALDPSERWLAVCNQTSGEAVVLARNVATGLLSAPVCTVPLEAPVCALFV